MPTQTSTHPPTHTSPRSLWFGTTAAAIAWVLHGFVCEIISSQACQDGTGNWGPLSPLGVRWLLAGITLGFLAVAVAGGIVSFRNWRHLTESPDLVHAEGRRREQFMALGGIFVSAAFVIGIVWAGIPLIFLDICMKAR